MRRRHKKALFSILVLLVAIPLLLKGVMYLRAKAAVDDFIAEMAGQARIGYRDIETGFDGSVTVLDLEIQPYRLEQPIHIDRVLLATDDIVYFLDFRSLWTRERRKPLDQFHLGASGIRIPLQEALMPSLSPPGRQGASLAPLRAVCEGGLVTPPLLRALGMRLLQADLQADYRVDRAAKTIDLQTEIVLRDIESIRLALRLAGMFPEDLRTERATRARLARAEVALDIDPAFGRRWAEFCARRSQLSLEAFLEAQVERNHRQLSEAGIHLGEALQKALDHFTRNMGRLRIVLQPPEPIAILQVFMAPPERLVSLLGLQLELDGQPVLPLDIRVDPGKLAKELPVEPAEGLPAPSPPRRYRLHRRFEPTTAAALGDLLGRKVRIRPRGWPVREGTLIAIVNGEALVEQRKPKGKVVAYVPLDEIERVEVETVTRQPER